LIVQIGVQFDEVQQSLAHPLHGCPFVARAAYCTRSAVAVPVSSATVQPVAAAIWIISVIFAGRRPERMRLSVDCEMPVRSSSAR
jgi:hypothetical protein